MASSSLPADRRLALACRPACSPPLPACIPLARQPLRLPAAFRSPLTADR